ncbi:unnamed protein product [Brachionus calyciflorus]|uniref:Uncharacterized protein n=1 Tax=Brachionus calyciflorus TaxID=104777 RepID=A0A814E4M7_9BILA|nr:unnamed protein product [Brachionus calyciflorus]
MNKFSNLTQHAENPSYQIDLEQNSHTDLTKKTRNLRIIHCGDGIIEECSEDEEEKERIEREEKRKQEELRAKMELEAKNMPWLPWMAYMAQKSAEKSLEVCDSMGEKLAWWFGITKPKFLYEIEEYNRIKLEEENSDDKAEEIIIGIDTLDNKNLENSEYHSDMNFLKNKI